MKLLHTSDWHIGQCLYGRKRYAEFAAFLEWLAGVIDEQRIDVLVVAGDVFDSSAPSHRAQQLYYRFLCRIAALPCRHLVVVAGNHDSPSFLNAPRELLRAMNIHVVGNTSGDLTEEVLVLDDPHGRPQLIVCAVPYLRDRDIRRAEAGEPIEDKQRKLLEGLARHYAEVMELARERRQQLGGRLPIIATGHLFTAGGQTIEGDGVRELYLGSLAHAPSSIFPADLDYLALGHLHVAQKVGGSDTRRYSGSPLPMGFGEAQQPKSLCLVELDQGNTQVQLLEVPVFQRLKRLRGNWSQLTQQIHALRQEPVWLEVIYAGDEIIPDLRSKLDAELEGSPLEILRVHNLPVVQRLLNRAHPEETLDELNAIQVFERCLSAHEIPQEQQQELVHSYGEILSSLEEDDQQAE